MHSGFKLPLVSSLQADVVEDCFEIIETAEQFRKALSENTYVWFRKGYHGTPAQYEYRKVLAEKIVIKDNDFVNLDFTNFNMTRFPCNGQEAFLILKDPAALGTIVFG